MVHLYLIYLLKLLKIVIFNSYVSLPEGRGSQEGDHTIKLLKFIKVITSGNQTWQWKTRHLVPWFPYKTFQIQKGFPSKP